jgi:hypothetical protein
VGTEEDGVDEAGRSSKPPVMTASAIDDVDTDTEAITAAVPVRGTGNGAAGNGAGKKPASAPSATKADPVKPAEVAEPADVAEYAEPGEPAQAAEPDTPAGDAEAGVADKAADEAEIADGADVVDDRVSDTDVADDDARSVKATTAEPVIAESAAEDSYSWSSTSWSSPSWNSSTSTWEPSSASSSASSAGANSPAGQSAKATGAEHVPFPADEVGKPKASPSAGNGAAPATRSFFEPAKLQAQDTETTPVDRLGAAASALSDKLDRGRQAWRQALTGPNSWLSSRGSAGSTDQASAPAAPAPASPSPFTPIRHTPTTSAPAASGGAGYSGSGFGSGSYDTPTARVGQPASAGNSGYGATGYADAPPRSASYGGPAADATLTAGAAAAAAGRVGTAPGAAGHAGTGQSGYGRTATGPQPAAKSQPGADRRGSRPAATVKGKRKDQRRQAQLTLSRVEPWSVMKFSFVVSVVAFIVLFVAVALLYMVLSSLGVFESLQHTINNLTSAKNQAGTNVSSWFSASRVLGYTGMLGALNIVLITAMSTIGAVIYNLIAHTIGGIEVTLRETD